MPRVKPVRQIFRHVWTATLLLSLALVSCWKVEADLVVSTNELNFGDAAESLVVTVRNDSEDNLLTNGVTPLTYQFKSDSPWLTISPLSGTCGEMEKRAHTVAVDRTLMVYGENLANIQVTSNGGSTTIKVRAVRRVPGCNDPPSEPHTPSPAFGATGVSVNTDLSWSGGDTQCSELEVSYDIYFGDVSPPPFHHTDSLRVWTPGPLDNNTLYYWRVVAKDANGSTSGREWQFRTFCNFKPSDLVLVSPANNATGVSIIDDLSWTGGDSRCAGLTATYDVYFGTTSPAPFHHNTPIKYWDAGILDRGTKYYWRIVAKDANGTVSSEERNFTTAQAPCATPPTAVTLTAPAHQATDVPLDQDLFWSGGDSQCPDMTATYDVYFGTQTPPPFHHNNGTSKTWDPGALQYDTIYYWRIVAKDAAGSVSSSERWFRTPCSLSPGDINLIGPDNGMTGVSISADLLWGGGNSRCPGQSSSYDVYFGTTTPAPFHHNNGSDKYWDPGVLEYGKKYYWRITASDDNGTVSSGEWNFTTEILTCSTPPTAVGLVSPANGATVPVTQDLSWTGGNSQCAELTATYDVYFGTTPTPPFDHDNGTAKTWDPGVLLYNTTYYWRIVAKDLGGSVSSETRSFKTPCNLTPGAPTLSSPANAATGVSVDANLSWTGGNSQCPGLTATYDVYFGTTTNPAFDHNNGSTKNWDPGTLANSTTYYWKIVAKDTNGETASPVWSFTTEALPCLTPPTAVSLVSPPDAATVQVDQDLSWSGGDSQCPDVTATYDVYFGTTSPPPLDHNNGSAKSWDPGTLQYNTTYYWRVVAKDAGGSVSSVERSFQTPCNLTPGSITLVAPGNAATGININANIQWGGGNSQCPGLTATYDVYFGTTANPAFHHDNGSTKSWDPGTLDYSTTYYWKIVARDTNGETTSPVWSFTTEDLVCEVPPTAVSLVAPANSATDVPVDQDLSWTGGISQCDGVTATYDVYFGTTTPPPFDHDNGTSQTWDPGTLQYNTTYYWRIVAKDAGGSVSSETRSFQTPCNLLPAVVGVVAPGDLSTGVDINADIEWSGGESQCPGLTASYYVYFGTATNPTFQAAVGTSKTWDPGTLAYGTTYYWKIVSQDANGDTESPVWSFTTVCLDPPAAACSPSPGNGSTGVNRNSNLQWGCGDSPCGTAVTYDVYLGTSPTLGEAQKLGSTTTKNWNLPRLDGTTTYYWKVIVRDVNGTVEGPTWSFTTRS